jgi:hypothetical protein
MEPAKSRQSRRILAACFATFYAFVLLTPAAGMVYAQETPVPVVCVTPADVARPTGSSAHTYQWRCDTQRWENDYYTWNPTTKLATPKHQPEHRLNTTTNMWEVWEWQYVASSGNYEQRITASYAATPLNQIVEPTGSVPAPHENPHDAATAQTPTVSTGDIVDDTSPRPLQTADGMTTQQQERLLLTDSPQTSLQLKADARLNNTLASMAVSGDASVLQNTSGGNATSGNALAMANMLNMLQSAWGLDGALPELYVADIQGDYFGDILIDPGLLSGVNTQGCDCGDLSVQSSNNATISNDIDLVAQSGDAAVANNTSAGNATSGDASALANIVNLIQSSIMSGSSFLGVLNIQGNLNGDVLVAQDVIDELLAANVPTTELSCACGDMLVELNDSQMVRSVVSTEAVSGNAAVANNTSAGGARSGEAQTNVTVFNVTGKNIVGQNALLVFVNVLGDWVGFLVDAPAGSTAAAYGGEVEEQATQIASGSQTQLNSDTKMSIDNDVSVSARTGDADVRNNTRAGDALSGDATAAVNIGNITNSTFNLAGWFGLLFINILGDWYGSFGTDTPYGDSPPAQTLRTSTQQAAYDAKINKAVHPVSTHNAARSSTTKLPRSSDDGSVRIFQAAVTTGKDGDTVLTNVKEITPPSSNLGAARPSSVQVRDVIIGWVLVVTGGGTLLYFMRRGGVSGIKTS